MRKVVLSLVSIAFLGCGAADVGEESESVDEARLAVQPGGGLLPDLRTVVPRQMNIQNTQQGEWLRFSNGVANNGVGPLRLRPGPVVDGHQAAIQEILDANGNIVQEATVSNFEFHESHNHWHIDNVARYEVRSGALNGPLVGSSIKVTYCLIDWYRLDGGQKKGMVYWDCATSYQGISPGWVDQYHHSLPDQEVEMTGSVPGLYYLVSTANPNATFIESDTTNNTAWVSFNFTRDSQGNPKITETGHSACETPGLCGDYAPNR
jgi:hypothetical protein